MQWLITVVLSCIAAIVGAFIFAFLCFWIDTGPINAWAFWHGWVVMVFPALWIFSFRRVKEWIRRRR